MTYELALMEREELGEERGREITLLENLRSIMESFNISAEKAMEALKIPKDKQPYYSSKLKEQW